ncbi:hypothetical protein NKG94_50425 [Micromonospora sp. M12]
MIDSFTEASNTSNAHLTYLARFDPATGRQLAGQMLLARIDTKGDQGNTISRMRSPPTSPAGCTRGRLGVPDRRPEPGHPRWRSARPVRRRGCLGAGVSADLKRRTTWTVFTDGGAGAVRGWPRAPDRGRRGPVDKGRFWRTRSVQSGGLPDGGSGYLAAWPGCPDSTRHAGPSFGVAVARCQRAPEQVVVVRAPVPVAESA